MWVLFGTFDYALDYFEFARSLTIKFDSDVGGTKCSIKLALYPKYVHEKFILTLGHVERQGFLATAKFSS
jgi:hypothetical protein